MKPDRATPVASQRIADVLAERILSGSLPPDARIKQDELAAEFDTSRIPVREALRILEVRGLVSLKANAGARVASLTVRDMELSYEIREKLEPMLLAESMPHLTAADFDEMRAINIALETARDVDTFLPLNRAFHWTAFRGHRAPLLADIVERLWDRTQAYRRAYARLALEDPERMAVMRSERDLLLRAIERRETDLAPRILAMHIRRTHLGLRDYGDRLAGLMT
jgi:DNA-binding GntR family transcriptional regulator